MAKGSAVEQAYTWLRERVLDGRFAGGSYVDEGSVCEELGISRTPVREAFNRLEGEGYLNLTPRKGAQVRSLSSGDVHSAFDARFIIEAHAVREFCAGSRRIPEAMRTSLKAMTSLGPDLTPAELKLHLQADRAFHSSFVATLGNPLVSDFYEATWRLNEWSSMSQVGSVRHPAYTELVDQQHRAILEALESHSALEAIRLLREHLRPFSEVSIFLKGMEEWAV